MADGNRSIRQREAWRVLAQASIETLTDDELHDLLQRATPTQVRAYCTLLVQWIREQQNDSEPKPKAARTKRSVERRSVTRIAAHARSNTVRVSARYRHGTAMLESIPGEIIAEAAAMLPDAKSAPDEPHNVVMPYNGRRILITFRRFEYTRGKTTLWFWTATGAAPLDRK